MILKINDKYYKIHDLNGYEIKDEKKLKNITEQMKLIKFTLDIAEDYVNGDCMSYLDTCGENRVEIYKRVLEKIQVYIKLVKIKVDEEISIL